MPRLDFNIDEATLLKAYKISSLNPSKWEEIDYDLEEDITDASALMMSPSADRDRDKEDPLGLGPARSVKELDNETKSSVLLTSKTFSPAVYLSFAHPNATYHDLSRGMAHLQGVIEAREEALRTLVEEGFDRFVTVKSAVDGLYEDMKLGILDPKTDHASKPLRDYLRNGSQKANQIFLPVLETAAKAQKLRTTLSVFERSKFFFNLPSFIMESIDAGKYEYALRDYKKGKYLLENRPGQLLPISMTSSSQSSASLNENKQQQQQQKRILNKVWASVEKAMGELRKVLLNQLQDCTRSVEEQEKTLETLVELQTSDELVWTYFDGHHKQIMEKMNAAHRAGIKAVNSSLQSSSKDTEDLSQEDILEQSLKSQLRMAIAHLETGQADSGVVKSPAEPVWDEMLVLVKSISEAVSNSLPSFWRVSKDFIDGKYRKTNTSNSGSRRSPTQCRTMANEIIKLYISLISQVFKLSEVAVMSRSQSSSSCSSSSLNKLATMDTHEIPPLFPPNSNSLSTAYHLHKFLSEVQECAADISVLDISSEVASGLKSLVESLRWRFIDVLVHDWVRDAKIFYHLETWLADTAHRKYSSQWSQPTTITTRHLDHFELFQKYVTAAAYKMVSNNNGDVLQTQGKASLKPGKSTGIPQNLITKVTRGFVDAVYKFLDGIMLLASNDAPITKDIRKLVPAIPGSPEFDLAEVMDLKDGSVRILLMMSNLQRFRKTTIPSMIKQLENYFGVSLSEDRRTLNSVVDELDKSLFEGYVQPRAKVLKRKIHKAIIEDKFDWVNAPLPLNVRFWTSEVLDYLVEAHGQLYEVAPSLLDRVMNALIEAMAKETSKCFKTVTLFGTGGFLQAVMDMTFMFKSLSSFGRDTPGGLAFERVFTKEISGAYTQDDKVFQPAFQNVQKGLGRLRNVTGVQYLCFRKQGKNKESSSKEKSRRKDDLK